MIETKKTKNNRILNKKVHEIVKTKTKCCGEPAFEGPLPKGHKPQGLKRYLLSFEYPICSECMEFADFVQLFYYNKLNNYYPDFKFEGNYTYTNSFSRIVFL